VDPFRLGLGSGLDRFGCNMTESIWLVSVRARIGLAGIGSVPDPARIGPTLGSDRARINPDWAPIRSNLARTGSESGSVPVRIGSGSD